MNTNILGDNIQNNVNENSFAQNLYQIKPFFVSPETIDSLSFESKKEKINGSEFFENDSKEIESLISELNEAVQININIPENELDECQELLNILKKPQPKMLKSHECKSKNICKMTKIKSTPFKSLKHPKKISLVGRVLSDIPSCDTQCSSNQFTTTAISTP